jgi:hypothetical protein
LQVVTVVAVLALLVTAGFFFFRGGGDDDDVSTKKTKKKVMIGDLELVVGAVYNANAGPPAQLPTDIQNQVMTTLGTYVQGGLLDPIREGETARDVAAIFDAGTAPQLDGPDRAVLLDEGLPELTGNLTPVAKPVILSGLSDGTGSFVLVTANLTYEVKYEADEGDVTSTRFTELTMAPEGSAWKITGYDIVVTREVLGRGSTTTTAAA